MCSCCCKKSRQGKGCCTWMVHGVLANFLSLANLLNFLLSVFILGYSVYLLKLRSYHLDVPAIVLLYTGGLSFLFSLCFGVTTCWENQFTLFWPKYLPQKSIVIFLRIQRLRINIRVKFLEKKRHSFEPMQRYLNGPSLSLHHCYWPKHQTT